MYGTATVALAVVALPLPVVAVAVAVQVDAATPPSAAGGSMMSLSPVYTSSCCFAALSRPTLAARMLFILQAHTSLLNAATAAA